MSILSLGTLLAGLLGVTEKQLHFPERAETASLLRGYQERVHITQASVNETKIIGMYDSVAGLRVRHSSFVEALNHKISRRTNKEPRSITQLTIGQHLLETTARTIGLQRDTLILLRRAHFKNGDIQQQQIYVLPLADIIEFQAHAIIDQMQAKPVLEESLAEVA
jgi:hypothetical protein